jgi:ubiquinone/menaquinone biosynthesis C-methylase UbiE
MPTAPRSEGPSKARRAEHLDMDRLLEATSRSEHRHFWFRGFRRFVTPFIAAAVDGVQQAHILDCGCGTGHNLDLLQDFGLAFGIDVSTVGLQLAHRVGRERLTRGSVTGLPFGSARFDLVTSFDVLYALEEEDEHRAVGEMFRVLRPGGAAVLNVAAMPVLRGNHSVLSHEIRRYTARRLREALEGWGFRIERITHTYASIFPVMLAIRVAQRLAGLAAEEKADREIAVPPVAVNAVLSSLLAVEARTLRWVNLPFGSSLLCLARKPAGRP